MYLLFIVVPGIYYSLFNIYQAYCIYMRFFRISYHGRVLEGWRRRRPPTEWRLSSFRGFNGSVLRGAGRSGFVTIQHRTNHPSLLYKRKSHARCSASAYALPWKPRMAALEVSVPPVSCASLSLNPPSSSGPR